MTYGTAALAMVDCGSARCLQEKRAFKKDLLSWSKKIPLVVGLEIVAHEVGGRRKVRRLLEPFNCFESASQAADWDPSATTTTKCYFCLDKNSPPLPTARFRTLLSESFKSDNGVCAEQTPTSSLSTTDHFLKSLLPFMPFTPDDAMDDLEQLTAADAGSDDVTLSPPNATESPLDLSSKSGLEETADESLRVPSVQPKSTKRRDGGSKRGYTDEDLRAAVQDIRSGRLGTRRAAVLYGIPRSTLRNKLFKLDAEPSESSSSAQEQRLSMSDLLQNSPYGDTYLSAFYGPGTAAAAMTQESELLRHHAVQADDDFRIKLEQLRKKHNLTMAPEKFGLGPFIYPNGLFDMGYSSYFGHFDYSRSLESKLPFLPDLVRKMTEERVELERSCNAQQNDVTGGGQPGGVQLKIPSYKPIRQSSSALPSDAIATVPPPQALPKHEVLTEPGHKIGDTLKNMIARSIADKVRSRNNSQDGGCSGLLGVATSPKGPSVSIGSGYASSFMPYSNGSAANSQLSPTSSGSTCSTSAPTGGCSGNGSGAPANKKMRLSNNNNNKKQRQVGSAVSQSESSDSENKGGKKTRPKRGQYRKYNSQLLLEAVRAVQRGEMSVHRAGSYYGVPHSTLEYKVKERHLLRQKKVQEQKAAKEAAEDKDKAAEPEEEAHIEAPVIETETASRGGGAACKKSPDKGKAAKSIDAIASNLAASVAAAHLPQVSSSVVAAPLAPLPNLALGAHFPLAFPWVQPNGGFMGMTPQEPAMPYTPPSFSMNNSASELLKKLQQQVQAKGVDDVDNSVEAVVEGAVESASTGEVAVQ